MKSPQLYSWLYLADEDIYILIPARITLKDVLAFGVPAYRFYLREGFLLSKD